MIFFFNDTATTEIYTLSLHDALPISYAGGGGEAPLPGGRLGGRPGAGHPRARGDGEGRDLPRPHREWGAPQAGQDRKSTRLNSSHANISYAVFCLKKKQNTKLFSSDI